MRDPAQIRKRYTKVFASAEQISSLLELKLEPGCTWRRLFLALYFTKQGMLKEMRHGRGFTTAMDEDENVLFPCFGGLDAPFVIYESSNIIDDVSLISCGSIVPRHLVRGNDLSHFIDDVAFSPDLSHFMDDVGFSPDFTSKEERVDMDELNLFHKVFLICKKQGHPEFYGYDGPPLGLELVCVFEGICYWSAISQRYQLVYSMCSLRRLYQQCCHQVALEYDQCKDALLRHLLSHAPDRPGTTPRLRVKL